MTWRTRPAPKHHGCLRGQILTCVSIALQGWTLIQPSTHLPTCQSVTIHVYKQYTYMYMVHYIYISVQFSHSVVSASLRPHELQHARPPCPSPTPRVHSDSRPLSQWCHPDISSSLVPFSSCPNPFQHQSLFQWVNSSHEVAKVLGVSAVASFLPKNTQDWSPSEWTGWISLQSKGLPRVFSNTTVQKHQFFSVQVSSQSNSHIYTWPLEKPYPWLEGPCWQNNVSAFEYAI